jgi:hypothetical protein
MCTIDDDNKHWRNTEEELTNLSFNEDVAELFCEEVLFRIKYYEDTEIRWCCINGNLYRNYNFHEIIDFVCGGSKWYINGFYYTYEQLCYKYKIIQRFNRYCLKKIRMRRLRRLRFIHGELLCMPVKGSYLGGRDYHQMISYFMSM